ncbi:MAG: hypothetical protein ABI759_05045 [Candidatus Solibacter sp.]
MFKLPIPQKGDADFLRGNGHLHFETANDAWNTLVVSNTPFPKDTVVVADVGLSLDEQSKAFEFGRQGSLKLAVSGSASFSHQVHLLWPHKDSDVAVAQQRGLTIPSDHIYARIVLGGKADGAAGAGFPVGPVSATIGIGAGGHASYERWFLTPDTTGARDLLTGLYAGLRLPQSIDHANELPAEGELLMLGYGGYLKLNAGVTWGYEIKGSKTLDVPKMPLDLDYQFRAMAAVNFGYRLAGEYQIEARRARADWVRFTVRKSRDSQTTLAADFGVTAQYEMKGLPDSADEFLSKVFGAHADRILELFHQGQKYSDLTELENTAGKLLKQTIHAYSDQVLGIVLSDDTVQAAIQKMQQVAGAYAHLDKRIIDLYHDVLKEGLPEGVKSSVEKAIDTVLGKATREDFAGMSGSPEFAAAIDLLRKLYNERLFDVLQKNDTFAEAVGILKQAKSLINGTSEADAQIKKWIDMLESQVPFDSLLKRLDGLDAAGLKALADERLQGIVEKLLGKAWSALNASDFKKAADLVHQNFNKIDQFKNEAYKKAVDKVTRQSFEMDLHLAYSRARKNEKLLEVEVNLAQPDGPALARSAAAGDYEHLLKIYNTAVVKVIKGAFSTELRNSMNVKFNVLGFGSEGLVTLFQRSEEALEPRDGGLLHVYTSETYVERKRKSGGKFKEEVDAKFLVQAVGESFQKEGASVKPYAIEVLRSMTSSYSLFQSDEKTRSAELIEYLRLANEVGLLDQEPRQYVEELVTACGGDLGKVQLTYRVGFDAATLHSAFKFVGDAGDPDGGELGVNARQAMRGFIWRKFGASGKATSWFPRVAFAYASDVFYRLYRQHTLTSEPRGVTVPSWFSGWPTPTQVNLRPSPDLDLLDRLYRFEDRMVAGLLAVDAQVEALDQLPPGGTVDWKKLDSAIRKLVDAAGKVAEYDDSIFPVILDRLIQLSTKGTAKRDSTLLLEVTPTTGPLAGQKITRILASGPKNPAEIAIDDTVAEAQAGIANA